MANIDWPINPNIGDIHTQNGNSWEWNGYAWDGVPVNPIPTPIVPEWQRPNDWIAIPVIAPGEEVFYGLMAVYDVVDGNRVAFTFAGNYTVDWGDGSPLENVLSGIKAEHLYDFANVANPTSEGWRQALIKVIPTGAANIISVDLQQQVGVIANGKVSQFMDIVMSVPNVTGAGTNLVIGNGAAVIHRVVERIDIRDIGAINTMEAMFNGCNSLQSVPLFNTASVTNMTSMFQNCSSLQSVPLFNTASVTNMQQMFVNCSSLQSVPLFITGSVNTMQSMFQNCNSLQSVPLFNTASVTNMTTMFQNCSSLQSVPLFNTASVTNMPTMFQNCSSLQSVPLFNTASVTNMTSMFQNCSSLQSVPLFNTASVTNMQQMFVNCSSLQSVPLFITGSVNTMQSMFLNCSSLQTVPLFDTATVTNMNGMIANCISLQSVPLFNTAIVTDMSYMFSGCNSLQSLPLFNTSSVTSMNSMFSTCNSLYEAEFNMVSVIDTTQMFVSVDSLQRFIATGLTRGVSVANNLMSATELDNFFTSLGTASGVQTITVTGNPGAATCDTSIATTKNFTVQIV